MTPGARLDVRMEQHPRRTLKHGRFSQGELYATAAGDQPQLHRDYEIGSAATRFRIRAQWRFGVLPRERIRTKLNLDGLRPVALSAFEMKHGPRAVGGPQRASLP